MSISLSSKSNESKIAHAPKVRGISLVVPTRNRTEDLRELLQSILDRSVLPSEVIVVDDSEEANTEDLIKYMFDQFSTKTISLIHLRGKNEGITGARNLGSMRAKGKILCFVDDDLVLDKDYLKEILKIYAQFPNALGVGGYETGSEVFSVLSNSIHKVFFPHHFEKGKRRVLRCAITFPYSLENVITCD